MVRGGTALVGALALCASLGGCHLIFGHNPGSGETRGDGRPRLDTRSREGAPGLEVSRPLDGPSATDGSAIPCVPTTWCQDEKAAPAIGTLYDVSGTDDASSVYAVGVGVVLRSTSAQRIWQTVPGLPSATWRGVYVFPTRDAVVVGNAAAGNAIAYHVPTTGSPTPINVATGIKDHTLNAVWMETATSGYVVTTAKSIYGGTISTVNGSQILAGPSFGAPINGIDGSGPEVWAVGEKGWLGTYDQAWQTLTLTGTPALNGVVALGLELSCLAGSSAGTGYVACCDYLLKLECPIVQLLPAALGIKALRDITTGGAMVVAVGEGGAIVSAGITIALPPTLGAFGIEASTTTNTLHAVWGAPSPTAGKYDAWAVGDGGAILHRKY